MVVVEKPTILPLLTSHIQLCLAHYCDLHGPTPLMVTEGVPVPCGRCYDDTAETERPHTSNAATGPQASITNPRSASSPVCDQDVQTHRAALLRASKLVPGTTPQSVTTTTSLSDAATIQTPPESPRKLSENSSEPNSRPGHRRDSSFRRTYDDYVTKRANPCQNCALTLPKRQGTKVTKDASAKTTDSKSDQQGPILRTRAPYARVYGGSGDASPPASNPQSSCTSDAEEDVSPKDTSARSGVQRRPATSTSQSSVSSRSSISQHTHYLDYTSTHEPTVPSTYSIVRASCLRTLSFETLPRRPESAQSTSSLSSPISSIPPPYPSPMNHSPGYITSTPSSQSAGGGGPIFFGDPMAGYTTAYIFRIPDMHARGRKRVYAFLALSTHRERLAMKTFGFISAAFRDLANWIQELAEAEAEREREREEGGNPVAALNAAYRNGGLGGTGQHDSGIGLSGLGGGVGLGGGGSEREKERERDRGNETTSFLTGGGRGGFVQRMGGSMGPGGFAPKARGLAELVGLPDFFIELHSRFVQLLLELGVVLGS
ncbi:vesicle coat protein [Biscogniauxia mediterranea]|nr:vesicle coat protein [Biscogniauxia mediterranea]